MERSTAFRIYALCLLLAGARLSADAGEIRLRSQATPAGEVVRLADLAIVTGESPEETERLQRLPLFPIPAPDQLFQLDRGDLQQLLLLHDADIREWRITGAEIVTIARATPVKAAAKAKEPPKVKPAAAEVEEKESKSPPKTMLVAAFRALTQGDVVKESDVHLIAAEDKRFAGKGFLNPEEVIGKEVIRSIPPGRPIEIGQVQPLRLVKRGDTVTVRAKAAGVSVTTTGKAMEDGAANDVISVEPTSAKDRILARVTGEKFVEVYAAGPQYPTGGVKHE